MTSVRREAPLGVGGPVFVVGRRAHLGCLVGALFTTFVVACGDSSAPAGDPAVSPGSAVPPSSNDVPSAPSAPSDGGAPTNGVRVDAGPSTPPLDVAVITPGKWAWFEFPNTICRDGSPTGFAMNLSPSGTQKVMFYLEGGGACFNAVTCAANPAKVEHKEASGGAFDRSNKDNPFAEYTHVFVPYCTGDVHAGNHPDADVAGKKQQFVGYTNTEYFLKKVAATLPNTERLVVTGASAGGFGAAANFGQALRIFPSIPVNLVDDSGQLMREPPLAHCLQEHWKTAWALDKTIIAECGADCVGQADYLQASAKHWASTSKHAMGLISATGDEVIRFFFGFGAGNCAFQLSVSQSKFAAGLEDMKTQLAPYKTFGAFLYDGTNHTVMQGDKFYSTKSNGKSVAEWVKDIVESDVVSNVDP